MYVGLFIHMCLSFKLCMCQTFKSIFIGMELHANEVNYSMAMNIGLFTIIIALYFSKHINFEDFAVFP